MRRRTRSHLTPPELGLIILAVLLPLVAALFQLQRFWSLNG